MGILSARFALPSGRGIRRQVRLMRHDQVLIWPTGWSTFDGAFTEADRVLDRALSRFGHDGSITSSRRHPNYTFPGQFDWTTMAMRANRDLVVIANLPVGGESWAKEVQWATNRGSYHTTLSVAFTQFDLASALRLIEATGTGEVREHAAEALAFLGFTAP